MDGVAQRKHFSTVTLFYLFVVVVIRGSFSPGLLGFQSEGLRHIESERRLKLLLSVCCAISQVSGLSLCAWCSAFLYTQDCQGLAVRVCLCLWLDFYLRSLIWGPKRPKLIKEEYQTPALALLIPSAQGQSITRALGDSFPCSVSHTPTPPSLITNRF